MIPIARPLSQFGTYRSEIEQAMADVLESGSYILGPRVGAFESSFAEYCGVAHGIGVNSGTDAIAIALRALGVGQGDRVITVSHTALATVAAIVSTGATPVLIDIDPVTYTLDPNLLDEAMNERVKAVIPVHLYGNVADLGSIEEVTARWDVPIVEDCAQAAGAMWGEARAGSIGTVGCFSFYPTKNLGALGDGGMLVTDDAMVSERAVELRQYGWNKDRLALEVGVNSRLDELQAAILATKLPGLDEANALRASIADRYTSAFAELPLTAPTPSPGGTHIYHLYVVASEHRSALQAALAAKGIQSAVHYPVPVHLQRGYADRVEIPAGGLSQTERVAGKILSLPLYPELTDEEIQEVIDGVVSSCSEIGAHP